MRLMILLLLAVTGLSACQYVPSLDKVLPDKRTEYKKSKSMPDLEVPPDLTTDAMSESMAIPNEGTATLSAYARGRAALKSGGTVAGTPVASDEQWISVAGTTQEIWPNVQKFFEQQGMDVEIDDAELGVLESGWSAPAQEGSFTYRNKFKVFAEPSQEAGRTMLVVSSQRQEQTGGAQGWEDRDPDTDSEKKLAARLNTFLNGVPATGTAVAAASPQPATAAAAPARKQAQLMNGGDGKAILAMPEEFTQAWRETHNALQRAGFTVDGADQDKGVFRITYFDRSAPQEKGWFSKLAFWKDDEPQGKRYQISLTGVGDRTELIVLNQSGDWESSQDADRILSIIQNQYNVR